jgi:hypothetical protein
MKPRAIPLLVAGLLGAALVVGFEAGKTAYTKRYTTAVLKDPQPTADSIATLPFATKIKVGVLQGKWAAVTTTNGPGWVYIGNLSEEKPFEDTSIKGLRAGAGETTASVAARPLDEVTKDYANQKGLNASADDVLWLEAQSDKIDDKAVTEYLKANRKGEFQ